LRKHRSIVQASQEASCQAREYLTDLDSLQAPQEHKALAADHHSVLLARLADWCFQSVQQALVERVPVQAWT